MSEQSTSEKKVGDKIVGDTANFVWGTGRRKSAVARVRLFAGTGETDRSHYSDTGNRICARHQGSVQGCRHFVN